MGREIANMHLGPRCYVSAVKNDFAKRKGNRLHKTAKKK